MWPPAWPPKLMAGAGETFCFRYGQAAGQPQLPPTYSTQLQVGSGVLNGEACEASAELAAPAPHRGTAPARLRM